jgi:DNA-binding response OmpR family regulator
MPPNILLVTEPGGGVGIGRCLDDAGHRVQQRHSLAAACAALETSEVDLTLVELGPPEVDGAAALRAMRVRTSAAIVLIDSGRPAQLDRLLAAGADDFLSKPFTPTQLRARVGVALADRRPQRENVIAIDGLRLDTIRRKAWLDEAALELSRREFDLLACLAARAGEVVPRKDLARAVWFSSTVDPSRTIDVHLSWLRRKLGDTAARPRYLHTVRGVGFRLGPDAGSTRGSAAFARSTRDMSEQPSGA